MAAYFVILVVILVIEAVIWLLTHEAAAGWVTAVTLLIGLLLPVLRLLLRRGAPDDKFPWE